MSERKAVIKNADMGEEMQQDAVDCATQALEKFNIEKVNVLKDCTFLIKSEALLQQKMTNKQYRVVRESVTSQ